MINEQMSYAAMNHICEENQSLRKQLAEAKPAIDFCAGVSADLLAQMESLESLRKIHQGTCAELAKEKQRILFDQDAADKLSRCGAEVDVLQFELAKNKAAREWVEKWGKDAVVAIGAGSTCYVIKENERRALLMASELRALIQPEEKK